MNPSPGADAFEMFKCFHGEPAGSQSLHSASGPDSVFKDPEILELTNHLHSDRFAEVGLSLQHVKTIASDDPAVERMLHKTCWGDSDYQLPATAVVDHETIARLVNAEVRLLSYVDTVVRCGHFLTICPISGRALKSAGSFVTDTHHIAYRFRGDVIFYLLVGRFHGRRSALCIPALDLVVILDAPEKGEAIARWVINIVHGLLRLSLAEPGNFAARIFANSETVTLVIGGMNNFGHHIWQELSGIAQMIADGTVQRVKALLVGPHMWFDLKEVFPEISQLPVTKCASAEEMLHKGLTQHGTLLRPVGIQITGDLRFRLRRTAASTLDADKMAGIRNASEASRLVWINLRTHNKAWKTQIVGYANVLNNLQQKYGNIGVVYDGWRDTAEIRDEIGRMLEPSIIAYDTIGESIETSLVWAESVATFISVVGSGLVINSWLVRKPGVAHANRAHLGQRSFWNIASEGMEPTVFIDSKLVEDDGTLYGNYDFDWQVLLAHLSGILERES